MNQQTRFNKGLRLLAAFTLLGAILACGGTDDDSPPPTPSTPVVAPPQPVVDQPTAVQPEAPTASLSLTPGFMPDPQTASGANAGGTLRASTFDSGCNAGNIPTTPQHALTLTADFENLKIMVHSVSDTTLVIREPSGTYRCNDDTEGLMPAIEGAFAAGTYQIWVGRFSSVGNAAPYTIGFTELTGTTASSLPLP